MSEETTTGFGSTQTGGAAGSFGSATTSTQPTAATGAFAFAGMRLCLW